jgi:hypothetical protein
LLCAIASFVPVSMTTDARLLAQACPSITVSPYALPAGLRGTPYSATITQTGGTGAAAFAVSSGSVPAGLTLSSSGALSGTPTAAGAFAFTVTATDANGCTGSISYQMVVEPDPTRFVQKLLAAEGVAGDGFAGVVAISANGTTAALGQFGGTMGAVWVFTLAGTSWVQQAKLTPAGAVANDGFGEWVSISADGNTIVTGANRQSVGGRTQQGAGYVFTRIGTTWTQEPVVTATDGQAGDYFGWWGGISPDGQTVVFGAPQSRGDVDLTARPGAAYVFARSGGSWSQQARLAGSGVSNGEQFGSAVVVGTDLAVITANFDDGVQPDSGAAYVFTRDGSLWTEQTRLAANDGATGDKFGWRLRLSEDQQTLLATAVGTVDAQLVPRGAGYVFTRSGTTWSQQAKLMTAHGGSFFAGWEAALSHDTVLLGSPFTFVGDYEVGAAFAFVRTGTAWTERSMLVAPDAEHESGFGYGAALSGDTAIVGAPGATIGATGFWQGAAYAFQLTPVASSVLPTTGSTNGGTPVTIVAPNAATNATATLGGSALGSIAVSGNVLTGITPPHAPGTVTLAVTNPPAGLTGTLANAFTYVCPAIGVGPPTPLPAGSQGVPYGPQVLTASGGYGGMTFTVTSGALPVGLTLSAAGVLSGSPTQLGSFAFGVTATDANGCAGSRPFSVIIVCPSAACFSDDPLVAGVILIRAQHIQEIRDRINANRGALGFPALAWTDPALVPGVTPVKAQHLLELRAGVAGLYQSRGLPPPTYTYTLAPGVLIHAADLQELRDALEAFEKVLDGYLQAVVAHDRRACRCRRT